MQKTNTTVRIAVVVTAVSWIALHPLMVDHAHAAETVTSSSPTGTPLLVPSGPVNTWSGPAPGTPALTQAAPVYPSAGETLGTASVGTATSDLSELERARFSGMRLTLEILASAIGGPLAAYGTFRAICGSEPCIGGLLAGLGANMVATTSLTYVLGRGLGGRGTYFSAWYGVLAAVAACAPATPSGPGLGLAIGLALMPIVAPLFYEISSGMEARVMRSRLGVAAVVPSVTTVKDADGRLASVFGLAAVY